MNQTILIINFLTMLVTLFLGAVCLLHRKEPGAVPFFWTMALLFLWVAGTSFDLGATTLETKIFWRNVIQIGMALIPVTTIWFVLDYTKNTKKWLNVFLVGAALMSTLGIVLTFTNSFHHLIRQSVALTESAGQLNLVVEPTALGDGFVMLRFALMLFAIILLVLFQVRTFENGKKQIFYILIGFGLALCLLMIKNYLLTAWDALFPMSVIFLVPNLFIAFSMFRYDFLKFAPMAKDWVINSMSEGIVVFSADGRILEMNSSAETFFHREMIPEENSLDQQPKKSLKRPYGKESRFVKSQSFWERGLKTKADQVIEFASADDNHKRYYEIEMHHFYGDNQHHTGSVSIIRDVTRQKLESHALKKKAEVDCDMDIFHKQAYISYVQESKAELLSFLVIDIDKFKQINDQFGHPVGDKVIAAVVKAIKQCIRKDDFVGRIGGDEFSVALVNCDKACCFAIVNRILAQIPQVTAPIVDFGVTVSIGAVAEQNRQERDFLRMYQGADEALYLAKNNGGNNFCFYEDGAFKN